MEVLEVRTYRLRPGAAQQFDTIVRGESLPMLERHGVQVIHAGASIVDENQYILVRAFASPEEREAQLNRFYGSDEWLETLDARVMALIETYHTVVVPKGRLDE